MSTSTFLPSLNLATLVIVALVVIVGFLIFMRKRANRHPLAGRRERNVAERIDADQAAPDHSPRT